MDLELSDDTGSSCSESLCDLGSDDKSDNDKNGNDSVNGGSPCSELWNDVKNGNDTHSDSISEIWNFKLGLLFHGEYGKLTKSFRPGKTQTGLLSYRD